jgi:N-methylhydantoinase A/oxoprolinase/acetone carboxylase beta subunit
MRGASYLAGIDLKRKDGTGKSMLVADVGGTTTDVGVLLPSGFPRQAAAFIEGQQMFCRLQIIRLISRLFQSVVFVPSKLV